MKIVSIAGVYLSAALLAGCTQSQGSQLGSEPEIGISHHVLDAYNNRYLASHTPMAFAVSESGGTYDYYYCEAARCAGGNLNSTEAISRAIAGCNKLQQGPCVLFAIGRSAPRKYHLID